MNVLLKTIKLLIICCVSVCLTSCKEEKNDNPESKSYTFDEILWPSADGVQVKANDKVQIDYSNVSQGYFMAETLTSDHERIKIQVVKDSVTYTYDLNLDNTYEVFPVNMSDGSYKVRVLENVGGDNYALLFEVNFDVTLDYSKLSVMDKWILSKLNSVVGEVDDDLGNYKIPEAARALQEFVDDLSNWYVRRSRERFWAKGMEQDKINAYMTLYTCLVTFCKAAAPMIPFMTEEIYQNLVRSVDASQPESIHLCDFPKVEEEHVDKKLEADMDIVLKAVVMGRACRNTANIKNRQPVNTMFVKAEYELTDFYKDIIADELNVKKVVFTNDVREFTSYTFKPQLRTVGPKYGKQLGAIKKYLEELDGNAAMDTLQKDGALKFTAGDVEVSLTEEDLLIEMTQKEGYVTEADNSMTVVLDTNLTPELIEEGFVLELISKIQTMRKDAGFEVTDHIRVAFADNDKIEEIAQKHEKEIAGKVLADALGVKNELSVAKEWNVNGENVKISVERV